MNTDLLLYYKERAWEYENVYSKPERQHDLKQATRILQQSFTGKSVFEIACGTGYWTEKIAKTATTILATDANETVLAVAAAKTYVPASVHFQKADIFNLQSSIRYQSLFGGFIWSHIPVQQLKAFLQIVRDQVAKGGTIVFMDNRYVPGSNLPISETDDAGNTYQMRKLENGASYNIVKNFPEEAFIKYLLADQTRKLDFINLEYYWILVYETA